MEITTWQAQLRKGAAEMAVLAVLAGGEAYGLAILQRIGRTAGLQIREGSIYPLLARLEKSGKITSRWVEDSDANHPRKYYALTDDGHQTLASMRSYWLSFRDALDGLIQTGDSDER